MIAMPRTIPSTPNATGVAAAVAGAVGAPPPARAGRGVLRDAKTGARPPAPR